MLRSQRNQLYQMVAVSGVAPAAFEWLGPEALSRTFFHMLRVDGPIEVLRHKASSFLFAFGPQDKGFHLLFTLPGPNGAVHSLSSPAGWTPLTKSFERWLKKLVQEVAQPDYWEHARTESVLAPHFDASTENTPFSAPEVERIRSAIGDLKQLLNSQNELSATQQEYIDARLQHMEEAAQRLGRKDWLALAVGSLSSIAIGAALAPEAARNLLHSAAALFGWVVTTLQALPQ